MGRRSLRRFIALALLLSWLAPGVGALAAGLRAGTGHHHDEDVATQLAMGIVHGHSHGVAEPAHDHPAAHHGDIEALHWFAAAVWLTTSVAAVSPPAFPATGATAPRRPPPEPLFYSHCALLL